MRGVFLLWCLWAGTIALKAHGADTPADAPVVQLVLELSDGSRIIGTPAVDRLKMTTEYSELEIRLPLLRAIEFSGTNHAAQVSLQNGDLLNGRLAATEISLKTIFGQVVIPLAQVGKIRVVPAGNRKGLPEGLVLYYSFDANAGNRVIDESGSGNDGAIQGATFTSKGRIGGAMSFNGDSQAVVVKNSPSLQFQDFTIMAWIKRGDKGKVTNRVVTTLKLGGGEDAGFFGFGQGGYYFGMKSDGHIAVSSASVVHVPSSFAILDDVFHHVAVTKKGNKIVFYLDGVAYPGPDLNATFEFTTDASVGMRVETMSNCWLGLIDELAVFNRPLSDDEVKGIYDSQK